MTPRMHESVCRVLERPAEGLAVIIYQDHFGRGGTAPWTRVTLRKDTECAVSLRPLKKGEQAYRPVGNMDYRMERIAPEVVEGGEVG